MCYSLGKHCTIQTEIFQVVCKCRPQSETALSALNNLCCDKVSHNIEKEKYIFFSDNEIQTIKISFR